MYFILMNVDSDIAVMLIQMYDLKTQSFEVRLVCRKGAFISMRRYCSIQINADRYHGDRLAFPLGRVRKTLSANSVIT